MKPLRWFALAAGLALSLAQAETAEYDLILANGRVVDGTGNPAFFATVAVKDGRIAAVGRLPATATAATNLDATGCVIAPGFIDVHTHADNVDRHPRAENFVRMGVTTLVAGNCGSSELDVGAFYRRVEAAGVSVNVATLIGHGTVRKTAMGGSFDRAPTAEELAQMRRLVADAMEAGAVGLSTGLIYLPGTFSRTDEIIELAKVAAAHDGIYASHMRDEGAKIFDALNELFTVARAACIRAEVSHLKLSGKANWGQAAQVLGAIEKARAEGLDVTQDQYLYVASSTGISQLIPEWAREGDQFKQRLEDPAAKQRIVAEMKEKLRRGLRGDYSYTQIAHYERDPSLNGLNIVEAAQKRRGATNLEDQIELILEIQKNGGASGVFFGISEEDLQVFLRHPNTMIACDSGIRVPGEGAPHPRGYGNSARVLARYVREFKVLTLEDAVRRLTSLPATTYRFKDRGLVRAGYWADLAVFYPDKIKDEATFKAPHAYATGFKYVLVNGVPVVENDRHTGAGPGRALRQGK